MIFDNIYENTVDFSSAGNIEFNFIDNKSNIRYLLDIIIDNNIIINNVFSTGTYRKIGVAINNSLTPIGIKLDSTKITLVLNGNHIVRLKLKQGYLVGANNSVPTPSYSSIPVGYSFNITQRIMTETQHSYYQDDLYDPLYTDMFTTINSLLDATEQSVDLKIAYSHDNDIYPKFAYTDNLISDSIGETGKNKQVSQLIEDSSISNALFINSDIKKTKLGSTVQASINLADSAVQTIHINDNEYPETMASLEVNLNLSDNVQTIKKDNITYFTYATDVDGLGTLPYSDIDIQVKIINSNISDGKPYFVTYNDDVDADYEYKYMDMSLFFQKENNIESDETITETNDLLYSSSKIKVLLDNKIDKQSPVIATLTDQFTKISVNDQGQVTDHALVELADLSALLNGHYEKTGVKRVMNSGRSTIFYM